jgi:hypothetical protein
MPAHSFMRRKYHVDSATDSEFRVTCPSARITLGRIIRSQVEQAEYWRRLGGCDEHTQVP